MAEQATLPDRPGPRLVSLAAVTWDFKLVGRTRMLVEAWQRLGQAPLFVEIPSLRGALSRLTGPLFGRPPACVVRAWPTWPARWWARISEERLCRAIRTPARWLRRRLDRLIDWDDAAALVVTPAWTPWLRELPFRHVIYDCIDELSVQTPLPELAPLFKRWEDELIKRCSAAVVSANVLAEGLSARRSDLPITTIRNGVDARRFRERGAASPRPPDMPPRNRQVIGFVGALYEWIDWPLIVDVAGALPDIDFVFVGPHDGRSDVGSVAALTNVTLHGAKPYDTVPAYMAAFDACWVPFKQDSVAAAANPVKIYEYLALGKPVVSTPVADTESFDDLVAVGRTPEELITLLRRALSEGAARAEARQSFADHNSWDARAAAYARFVASLDDGD